MIATEYIISNHQLFRDESGAVYKSSMNTCRCLLYNFRTKEKYILSTHINIKPSPSLIHSVARIATGKRLKAYYETV